MELSQWEYEFIESWYDFWDNEEKYLNAMGENGWELVTINFEHKKAVLKRQIKKDAP